MENLDTVATLGTQDRGRRQTKRKPRGQSRMENLDTVATLGTQDRGRRQTKRKQGATRRKSRQVATLGTQHRGRRQTKRKPTIKNGKSRHSGNTGYTRQRTKTNKEKTEGATRMENLDTVATLGTQDRGRRQTKRKPRAIKNGKSRHSGDTGYTRHRTKTNKEKTVHNTDN